MYRAQQSLPGELESIRRLREGGPGSGPQGGSKNKKSSSKGKNVMSMDLYNHFPDKSEDEGNPAMDNMASQLKHIGSMKNGSELATSDKTITIHPHGAKEGSYTFHSKAGFTRAALLKATISAVRQDGGASHHYNSDVVVEAIHRSPTTGHYHAELGT